MRNLFLIITISILLSNYGYTKDIPKKYLDKDYIFKAEKKSCIAGCKYLCNYAAKASLTLT